jgi:hypothetical protein
LLPSRAFASAGGDGVEQGNITIGRVLKDPERAVRTIATALHTDRCSQHCGIALTAQVYTVQPDSANGFSDLVTMRHVSASESTLTLYRYDQGKYVDSGCYTATSPSPKDGEVQDPEIVPCNTDKTETK